MTTAAIADLRRHDQAGFTLLEVLAALSVFLIGIVSVLGLLSTGTRLHQESRNLGSVTDALEEAVLRSERQLEQLELDAGATRDQEGNLVSSDWAALEGHEGLQYRFTVVDTNTPSRWRMDVELQWREGGRWKNYRTTRVIEHLRSMALEVERRTDRRR